MTRTVPDEVWEGIDPGAGRLSRPEIRGVTAACVALLLLVALVIAGAVHGTINPRIGGHWPGSGYVQADHPGTRRATLRVSIVNRSDADETVTATTLSADNLRLVQSSPTRFDLPAHQARVVRLEVRLTGCGTGSETRTTWLQVVLRHWWGHETQQVMWESSGGSSGPNVMLANLCR